MARLTGTILSDDDLFRTRAADLLRSAPVAVSVGTERTMPAASFPDVVIVDGRSDGGAAIAVIERIRASHGTVAIFMIAAEANPSVILQAMRAGANEFFAWPV